MSISAAFANDLLKGIFNATPIASLFDNAATSPATTYYLTLNTADPGPSGTQATSEVNYTGYSRLAVQRSAAGWVVTGAEVSPASTQEFGEMTAGTNQTATHMTVGLAPTGGGKYLFRFVLTPPIQLSQNVTPRLRTTTKLTVVTS